MHLLLCRVLRKTFHHFFSTWRRRTYGGVVESGECNFLRPCRIYRALVTAEHHLHLRARGSALLADRPGHHGSQFVPLFTGIEASGRQPYLAYRHRFMSVHVSAFPGLEGADFVAAEDIVHRAIYARPANCRVEYWPQR